MKRLLLVIPGGIQPAGITVKLGGKHDIQSGKTKHIRWNGGAA